MTEPRSAGCRSTRRIATFLAATIAALVVLGSAPVSAQVPEVPEAPGVPEQVTDAVNQVNGTLVPPLSDAAITLAPVATALGFGLRAECYAIGAASVALALAGTALPVSVGGYLVPVYILCAYSYNDGPVDGYFDQVDAQIGPTFSEQASPVFAQIGDGIAPYRPNLSEGCSVLALMGNMPDYLPPPSHRVPVFGMVCGNA